MKYKGFIGKMEVDEDEAVIYGRVINLTKDGMTFGGETVKEAKEDFERAVDDYLEWAKEEGFEPEKPYQGNILVRTTPELHREAAIASTRIEKSLNAFAVEAIQEKLQRLDHEESVPGAASAGVGTWYGAAALVGDYWNLAWQHKWDAFAELEQIGSRTFLSALTTSFSWPPPTQAPPSTQSLYKVSREAAEPTIKILPFEEAI